MEQVIRGKKRGNKDRGRGKCEKSQPCGDLPAQGPVLERTEGTTSTEVSRGLEGP